MISNVAENLTLCSPPHPSLCLCIYLFFMSFLSFVVGGRHWIGDCWRDTLHNTAWNLLFPAWSGVGEGWMLWWREIWSREFIFEFCITTLPKTFYCWKMCQILITATIPLYLLINGVDCSGWLGWVVNKDCWFLWILKYMLLFFKVHTIELNHYERSQCINACQKDQKNPRKSKYVRQENSLFSYSGYNMTLKLA